MHEVTRIRRDIRRRTATVSSVTKLSPTMVRVVFASDDFADFESASPDDHVKIAFPNLEDPALEPQRRDFTPRAFDNKTLTVDFALHDAGPATQWASAAKAGDSLTIGGPRGSSVVPDDFDWYVFIGDETALPAIGRWVEQLRPGVPATTYVVTQSADDKQALETAANHHATWLVRSAVRDDGAVLLDAVSNFKAPNGDGFVWIAAEAAAAKALRDYFLNERQHPKAWIKASGYWKRGVADADGKTIE